MGGVVAVDELPLIVKKPSIFIVNTDPRHLPGKHWIVVYVDQNVCEHFNSSGRQPNDEFSDYMTVQGPNYLYNTNRVQAIGSDTCVLYCLFYAYFRCRGFTFLEIVNMFSSNVYINETIVKTFYRLTK